MSSGQHTPKYNILMIDCPWEQRKGGLRKCRPKQKRELDYKTMNIKEIFNLLDERIFPLAKETNTIFMWCIDKYLCKVDSFMFSRGYKRHCIFIWNKLNGIAPAFTVRYSHEYLIWYYKPKMIKICDSKRGFFTTVFEEKSREHSRKPNFAYNMINSLYPSYAKLDVFARENRVGWAVWGDEVSKFDGALL